MNHPSLQIIHKDLADFIRTDFTIKTLADDCRFTEGPVWNPDGYYLFSDIPSNCIYRIDENGNKSIFLSESGTDNPNHPDLNSEQAGSNGLAYADDGALLLCRHGSHSVGRYKDGSIETLIDVYNGRPLNSPNDLVLHRNGTLFFSDPPYGLKNGKPNPEKYQIQAGVYSWRENRLDLICERYQYPNGVCLSPDHRKLFICSNKPSEQYISVFNSLTMEFEKILANENSDGIKCDPKGNFFLCNKDGVLMLNGNGNRLGIIKLPAVPANLCWGGKEGKDMLICARQYVFLIKNLLK